MSDDYNDILIDVDWRFPAPKARKRYVPVARAEKAEAAIQRVRELHTPYRIMLGSVPTDTNCNGCNRTYPCPTIRALDGEQ